MIREQWSHHGKSYVVTVSKGTQALKLVMVFGMSSPIPDTSPHVQAVVDIEKSLGIGAFLMTPWVSSILLITNSPFYLLPS